MTYQQVRELIKEQKLSDQQIEKLLLQFVLSLENESARNVLSRVLIESFKGAIPFAIFERCVQIAHAQCMKTFPVNGGLNHKQEKLYDKVQEKASNEPLVLFLLFILNAIFNRYSSFEDTCHFLNKIRLHELDPQAHNKTKNQLLFLLLFLKKAVITEEISTLFSDVPIICGLATLACGQVLSKLGLPFQMFDVVTFYGGHSIILTGLPVSVEEKMTALESGRGIERVILMNPFRREILIGAAAKEYFDSLRSGYGAQIKLNIDTQIINFENLCHARSQLRNFSLAFMDAYYRGPTNLKEFLLQQTQQWLNDKAICDFHANSGLSPSMTDLMRAVKRLERDIQAPLLGDEFTPPKTLMTQATLFAPPQGSDEKGRNACQQQGNLPADFQKLLPFILLQQASELAVCMVLAFLALFKAYGELATVHDKSTAGAVTGLQLTYSGVT